MTLKGVFGRDQAWMLAEGKTDFVILASQRGLRSLTLDA